MTIPTVGFNIETVDSFPNHLTISVEEYAESELLAESKMQRESIRPALNIWDCGGNSVVRALWNRYCDSNNDSYIFMIDSSDKERFKEAKEEIEKLVSAMREIHAQAFNPLALLIVCNKADIAGAATVEEIRSELALDNTLWGIAWTIIATSATTNLLSESRRDALKAAVLQEKDIESEKKRERIQAIDDAFNKILAWGPGMEDCIAWLMSSKIYEPAMVAGIPSQI